MKQIFGAMAIAVMAGISSAQTPPKPVKLIEVQAAPGGIERQFFGQVVARETVDLAFQVAGQIVEFPVIEGDPVPEGALVAQLDLEPFERQLEQARLREEQAERNLDRLEQLSSNAVSQATIDDAVTEAGLAAIAVREAEYALEHATLHAPFDALVAARELANFTTIASGTPVVRLHDMSELRIEIDVPEILFQRAGEDPDVDITAQFPVSDRVFPLEVREFNAEASAVGQTFRLTFALPAVEGLNVLPGSSVTVRARINTGPPVIALPPSALLPSGNDGVSVMVFTPTDGDEGTVARRDVRAEVNADGGFDVLDGLEDGELVVAAGSAALDDGQAVRRFAGFPD